MQTDLRIRRRIKEMFQTTKEKKLILTKAKLGLIIPVELKEYYTKELRNKNISRLSSKCKMK